MAHLEETTKHLALGAPERKRPHWPSVRTSVFHPQGESMDQWVKSVAERPLTRRAFRWIGATTVAAGLAVGFSPPVQANPNLVTNGGFETGDFTGWLELNNFTFSGVLCPGVGFAPEGSCAAYFGPSGADGTLSQVLTTLPGDHYAISFFFAADGGSPADFSATWGGQTLVSLTNPAMSDFLAYSFNAVATGPSTTLSFNLRDDPADLYLDAVSVSVIPEPGAIALLGIGLAGLWAGRRRRASTNATPGRAFAMAAIPA